MCRITCTSDWRVVREQETGVQWILIGKHGEQDVRTKCNSMQTQID